METEWGWNSMSSPFLCSTGSRPFLRIGRFWMSPPRSRRSGASRVTLRSSRSTCRGGSLMRFSRRPGSYIREGVTELVVDGILTSIGRSHGHQGFLRMRGLNQEMMNIHVLSGESGSTHSFCDTPLSGYGSFFSHCPGIFQTEDLERSTHRDRLRGRI